MNFCTWTISPSAAPRRMLIPTGLVSSGSVTFSQNCSCTLGKMAATDNMSNADRTISHRPWKVQSYALAMTFKHVVTPPNYRKIATKQCNNTSYQTGADTKLGEQFSHVSYLHKVVDGLPPTTKWQQFEHSLNVILKLLWRIAGWFVGGLSC